MTEISQPAPIVLFVFSRPDHTLQTLKHLSENSLAIRSDLIIYADAGRNDAEVQACNEVRRIVKNAIGFRSVEVIERESNYGLARNIIDGVTDVCKRYGKAIILEDDLITSPAFLTFMNIALEKYKDDPKVWHISGWNYPINSADADDAYFLRIMNCWGWATWSDRWANFKKAPDELISSFNSEMINRFDLGGTGVFWQQVLLNKKNKINTWAIFWYATIFLNGGLCLNPRRSFVENIGHDGTGTHGSLAGDLYSTELNVSDSIKLPADVIECQTALNSIVDYYFKIKPTRLQIFKSRVKNLLRRIFYC